MRISRVLFVCLFVQVRERKKEVFSNNVMGIEIFSFFYRERLKDWLRILFKNMNGFKELSDEWLGILFLFQKMIDIIGMNDIIKNEDMFFFLEIGRERSFGEVIFLIQGKKRGDSVCLDGWIEFLYFVKLIFC